MDEAAAADPLHGIEIGLRERMMDPPEHLQPSSPVTEGVMIPEHDSYGKVKTYVWF